MSKYNKALEYQEITLLDILIKLIKEKDFKVKAHSLSCFMVTFELSTLEIFVYATISTAVVTFVIEQLLTWHSSKIITVQKRSDEFIEYSQKYYLPLAFLVAGIEAETDPHYNKVRTKILFFKLAKYISFYERFLDTGVGFSFPKYTQECKVARYFDTFNAAINLLIFNDDKEATAHVTKYYNENPDILSFIEKIDTLPEYSTFESICKNEEIIGKLYNYSDRLCNSITNGVTEEYRTWYKFELIKWFTERNINKSAEKEMDTIIKLHNDIYSKKLR